MQLHDAEIPEVDVDRILAAIGPAARVAYAAPHVFPMAAPAFRPTPCAERPQPAGGALRLYAHVPFCNYACSFCFFATRVGASRDQMERYVAGLERELEWIAPGSRLSQLFVGGGTPTALPADLLDRLLRAIFAVTRPHGRGVHTVEASPETISPEHIGVLRERGVGRVSMGIQSLDERVLGGVYRRHSPEQALAGCRLLAGSGLIFNVDLMYGLPGQTEASFRRDLELLSAEGVHSVTLYNLRLNEHTLAARAVSDEERLGLAKLVRWRAFAERSARELGYTQTRWHTFKRLDSIASRHERLPCFDDTKVLGFQLGIGMSARSSLGAAVYRNHADFDVYLDRVERGESPVEETMPLGAADRKTQFVAMSLGDGKPLERAAYRRAFGCDVDDDFGELLERLHGAELVEENGGRLLLTETGRLVHDVVTLAFYPAYARLWMEQRQSLALGQQRGISP